MSVSDHAQQRCIRFAAAGAQPRGPRYPAEEQALDRLPESDILCALRDLPDELKLAVYLADVEGYRYKEIAEIMGTPVGTVASRLHHGRGRIRDWLALSAVKRGLAAAPG